ncbi:MAG: thioredoxin family protein [Candidatus Wallbacteria bacterium]
MKIEVLGTGCAKCKTLFENVKEALKTANMEAEVVKVEELSKIMGYGVMTTPALVIDGKVKFAGKVLSAADLVTMLKS